MDEASAASPADLAIIDSVLHAQVVDATPVALKGNWRCRTIKLGGMTPDVIYGWFRCRISMKGGAPYFEKLSGSQRTSGVLYPEGGGFVYLGASYVTGEKPHAYSGIGCRDRRDGHARRPDRHALVALRRPRPAGAALSGAGIHVRRDRTEALMSAGYSGTPLTEKLGIKPGGTIFLLGAPRDYRAWLAPLPDGVSFVAKPPRGGSDVVHLFVKSLADLDGALLNARKAMKIDGALWISWYKKSANIPTDVGGDIIRSRALKTDLVDVKVCAVSDVWSGLKFVVRKHLR